MTNLCQIVIDTYGWNRFNPSFPVFNTAFTQKDTVLRTYDQGGEDSGGEDYDGGEDSMPLDGHFADEEDATKHVPLTEEQKLICSPLLRGYSLKSKLWLNFFVNCVKEIEWQKDAFDRLVLPKNQKELILGFTESQRKYRESFDDVIEGKGRGMIILLCGPPGVGKTLTAESVAEEMKVPLYMMSAGDLGLDPRRVESKLQDILEMCTRWNSVLLLDEADVFLEQRSLHELERNKLVSIFLRVLEYYEGTTISPESDLVFVLTIQGPCFSRPTACRHSTPPSSLGFIFPLIIKSCRLHRERRCGRTSSIAQHRSTPSQRTSSMTLRG
jgi:hypothetical protein